jgi:hypothetical protein
VELQELQHKGFGKVFIGKKRSVALLKPHPTSLEENNPILQQASISLDRYTSNFLQVTNMDDNSKEICLNHHHHRELLKDILTQFSDDSDDADLQSTYVNEHSYSNEQVSLTNKTRWYQKSDSTTTTSTNTASIVQNDVTESLNTDSIEHHDVNDSSVVSLPCNTSVNNTESMTIDDHPISHSTVQLDYIPPNGDSHLHTKDNSNITLDCIDDPPSGSYYNLAHTGMPVSQLTPVKIITIGQETTSSQKTPVQVVVRTIKLCKSQPKSDWKVKQTPK